ncbi:MAG: DNA-directed RNA polymerase subunit beta', partial [Planctomycetes bacterium]|nr:DNA-directed RNA polymerase subunit beta' [Planctomycetota bacterium]
ELVVLDRNGEIHIVDKKDRVLDTYPVPLGAVLKAGDGDSVRAGQSIAKWDPHNTPIFADCKGRARWEDLVEGKTYKQEKDASGVLRTMVIEHKGDLHPQIVIEDKDGNPIALHPIPEKAYVEIENGAPVAPGTLLAKTPKETGGTDDITGGLPRVTELFEARRPKEPAVMAEV